MTFQLFNNLRQLKIVVAKENSLYSQKLLMESILYVNEYFLVKVKKYLIFMETK